MKHELIAAVLAHDADEARQKIAAVGKAASWIQWDVMDGKFVRNTTWSDAETVRRWKILPRIELHLMVNDPEKIIRAWRRVKNFKRTIWHVEAPVDHAKLIARARRMGLEVGLAISPETPVATLVPYLRKIDVVLVMGVHPGWSGQKLIPATKQKVRDLRRLAPRLPIAFDGGITARNVKSLARLGVRRLCLASALYKQRDPAAWLIRTRRSLNRSAS